MHWCELHGVDYLFGLAKNGRLTAAIAGELAAASTWAIPTLQIGDRRNEHPPTTGWEGKKGRY